MIFSILAKIFQNTGDLGAASYKTHFLNFLKIFELVQTKFAPRPHPGGPVQVRAVIHNLW